MPTDIKTKNTTRDIKVFDRAADVSAHMKNASVKTKDAIESADRQAKQTQDTGNSSPSEYATDRAEQGTRAIAGKATGKLRENPVKRTFENASKAKENLGQTKRQIQNIKNAVKKPAETPKTEALKRAQDAVRRSASSARQAPRQSVKAVDKSGRAAGRMAQDADKAIKTASKTVKDTAKTVKSGTRTAGRTAKVAVKTAQQSTVATSRAAQAAAKAAKAAVQASKAAARVTIQSAKIAAKVTIATVKAIIAATKALVSAIAAGGWVAVVIIVIICLVAFIASSAFGIFFGGEDTGDGNPSLREVITEINTEQTEHLAQIRADTAHDDVIVSGSPAPWKEVLAVYAVKTTTDDTEPLDAITLDSRRQQILREVHEDMSGIDYRTQERETYQVTLVEEADGTLIEETETVTVTTLYITYNALSADEAAVLYGFDAAQLSLLHDLLSPEYDSAWQATLYGLHSGSGEIVEVAASQIGNAGGQPYWSWYGFGSRVEWCATFVSWCANECGYIESGVIPKFAGCEWQGEAWFKERGQWQERGYEPQPGDIIFFDWNGDDISDHVGIVESTSGSVVYTIEGNNGDAVYRDSYSITSSVIAGYGLPQY